MISYFVDLAPLERILLDELVVTKCPICGGGRRMLCRRCREKAK